MHCWMRFWQSFMIRRGQPGRCFAISQCIFSIKLEKTSGFGLIQSSTAGRGNGNYVHDDLQASVSLGSPYRQDDHRLDKGAEFDTYG